MKHMKKAIALACCFALLCLSACSGFEGYGLEQTTAHKTHGQRYRLLPPWEPGEMRPLEIVPGEAYPLVLFLHGSSGAGTDNESQMIPGQVMGLINGALEYGEPCYIYFPQYPSQRRSWGQSAKTRRQVMDALWQIVDDYPIDASRIYITGLSSGGNGAWHFLHDYPGVFAAAMPLCGWYDTGDIDYSFLMETPLWIAHNSGDNVVDVEGSRRIARALEALGHEDFIYTEYPEEGHNCWVDFYLTPEVWEWLFSKVKKDA